MHRLAVLWDKILPKAHNLRIVCLQFYNLLKLAGENIFRLQGCSINHFQRCQIREFHTNSALKPMLETKKMSQDKVTAQAVN